MKELNSRQDVDFLVDAFYKEAIVHPDISKYFTTLVAQHFDAHKSLICDFWDNLIFHGNKYKGNPMLVHLKLNAEKSLTPLAFETWLALWEKTVNTNFTGANAAAAIAKAKQIGGLMQFKMNKKNKSY